MAGEAIQNLMLALAKIAILIAMLDKAIFHIEGSSGDIFMTFPAQTGVCFNEHTDALGVIRMQAARSMAALTAHTSLRPGACDTGQVILIATISYNRWYGKSHR